MRVLVIGGEGQLGRDILTALDGEDVDAPGHGALDVTDEAAVSGYVEDARPDVVVNTSAYHDVAKCEAEPDTSFSVNTLGPRNLARACRRAGARFIHMSTDYVFDGMKGAPYTEDDTPRPLMVYGASKLAGEHLARLEWDKTFIVRTTGLFGRNPCRAKPGGRNFIETMLHFGRERGEVKVVDDQRCCPTYTPDLAAQIVGLARGDAPPGLYNAVTPPGCSWYELAQLIFEITGDKVKVVPVGSDAFPAPFRRPADSRLANDALGRAGILVMRSVGEAVREYLETHRESLAGRGACPSF
ncbi:MAG: dTDP-4-dehydrorhamnose reductase [Deltaproteobacteria bacterium]|nr:dTDP-4-dehydrorhamnose reductase [Deltaproteobacteria bacterium]